MTTHIIQQTIKYPARKLSLDYQTSRHERIVSRHYCSIDVKHSNCRLCPHKPPASQSRGRYVDDLKNRTAGEASRSALRDGAAGGLNSTRQLGRVFLLTALCATKSL